MVAVLIDASGYLYRAFYALPAVQRPSDSAPTGCILGFCDMLWRTKKKHADASHFAVIFDLGKSTDRLAIYPEYKARRTPMHEDMRAQLPVCRVAARAFGFPVIESQGIEADDLVASYAASFKAEGLSSLIVSSDKDLMQVIGPATTLYCPLKDREMGVVDAMERFGCAPSRVPDAQALIGDAVDNIPGVPKIGEKTAKALLAKYGTLENVLEFGPNDADFGKIVRQNLAMFRAQAILSRKLATLRHDVPLPISLDGIKSRNVDAKRLLAFAREMEFVAFADAVASYYKIEV